MEIFLIAAVDKNLAIGKNGKIPWHIKEDLQFFQKNTLNTAMIMGRSTFDSIGKPLPNRKNIVMTNSPTNREGVIEVCDIESAIKEAKKDSNERFKQTKLDVAKTDILPKYIRDNLDRYREWII